MISVNSLAIAVLAASGASATGGLPAPGSYGFNWLDAASHCQKITAKELAGISKCTVSTDAFGLQLTAHVCKINANVELMIYPTAAQCQEALETMQANGP